MMSNLFRELEVDDVIYLEMISLLLIFSFRFHCFSCTSVLSCSNLFAHYLLKKKIEIDC